MVGHRGPEVAVRRLREDRREGHGERVGRAVGEGVVEGRGDDGGLGSESDGGSDDGTGMTDAEFCAAIRPRATTAAAGSAAASMSPPSIEDLFSLDDDDDEMAGGRIAGAGETAHFLFSSAILSFSLALIDPFRNPTFNEALGPM